MPEIAHVATPGAAPPASGAAAPLSPVGSSGEPRAPEMGHDFAHASHSLGSVVGPRGASPHAHGHDHALADTENASWRLGNAAAWASSICAVHCLLTPVLVAVPPVLGLAVLLSPLFEWSMVAVAAVVGGTGLGLSYARVHRAPRPLTLFATGLALLIVTHLFVEPWPVWHGGLAVVGAGFILVAARMNHALVHACRACHPHPH